MNAKPLILSLCLLGLAVAATGYEPGSRANAAGDPPREGASREVIVVEHPLRYFQAQRLNRFMERDLPAALAEKNHGAIRRICDVGQETILRLRTPPEITEELEAVLPRFQRYCSVDVSIELINQTIKELEAVEEGDREMRCDQTAALTVTFSLKHDTGDPGVKARRDLLLAICPKLANRLEDFEKQRQEHAPDPSK